MKAVLFLFCIFITFCACKKEKKEPKVFQSTNQSINTDSINGEFTVVRDYGLNNDSLVLSNNRTFAHFFQRKAYKFFTVYPPTVNVGNIYLNGVQFQVTANPYNTYFDTTGTAFTMPRNWQVQGNSGHSAFTLTDNTDFPIYSKANSLPDTLVINQQDTIDIGNYSGSSVSITVQSQSLYLIKSIEYPSSKVIISANELSNIGLTEGEAMIYVSVNKSYYKPINGKVYRFTASKTFFRPVILKSS